MQIRRLRRLCQLDEPASVPGSLYSIGKSTCRKKTPGIQQFGNSILKELRLLCHWAKSPPNDNDWNAFYIRFINLLAEHEKLIPMPANYHVSLSEK